MNRLDRQLTVRLPVGLVERLDAMARRLQRKRSDVVRMALEQFLDVEGEEHPIEYVRDLLGQVESGIPDLGQRHREYLIRRLQHGR